MHDLLFKSTFPVAFPQQQAHGKCNEHGYSVNRFGEIMDDGITFTVTMAFMSEQRGGTQQAGNCTKQYFHVDDFLNNINPADAAFR
jgi:hypothetical protein